MRESRVSALFLMHIKYDMPVNLDETDSQFVRRPTPENDAVYQFGV